MVELHSHGYQDLLRPWEITGGDNEIDKKVKNNESMKSVCHLQVA